MTRSERWFSVEDGSVTVAIDTELTPELVEEGFVRELVSKLQTMRKEAGFNVEDHIAVFAAGNDKIAALMEKNKAAIASDGCWRMRCTHGRPGRLYQGVGHQRRNRHPGCQTRLKKQRKSRKNGRGRNCRGYFRERSVEFRGNLYFRTTYIIICICAGLLLTCRTVEALRLWGRSGKVSHERIRTREGNETWRTTFAMDVPAVAQQEQRQPAQALYEEYAARGLKLDMSRGQARAGPVGPFHGPAGYPSRITKAKPGIDARNYGNLEGMPEARRFFADILGAQPDEVIVGGNSSLNMMYYLIDLGWRLGFADSPAAWNACGRPKFLVPCAGLRPSLPCDGIFRI